MQEYINGKILINGKLVNKNFLIKDGKIFFDYQSPAKKKDISGLIVAPAFVDMHVHTRVPGFEEKEDIDHVTQAALAGGFSTLVAMGNINPAPINLKNWKMINNLLQKSSINIIQSARVSIDGNMTNIKQLASKTKIFSDDGWPISNKALMQKILIAIKNVDGLILLHEEDVSIDGVGYHSAFAKTQNLKTFGSDYEVNLIKRDIELNKNIGAKMHLQHISCKETIDLLTKAQKIMDISAEVSPHHLFFSSQDIDGSVNFKMNPPLNSLADKQALIGAFKKGIVNIVATDHAPHTEQDKGNNWIDASYGVIGLETAFGAVNTVMGNDYLVQTLESLSINPAKRIGLDREIKNAHDAYLVIIDPNEKWIVKKENFQSKSHNSPWIGKELTGKVKEVIWKKI